MRFFNFSNKTLSWKPPTGLGALRPLRGIEATAGRGALKLAALSSVFAAIE